MCVGWKVSYVLLNLVKIDRIRSRIGISACPKRSLELLRALRDAFVVILEFKLISLLDFATSNSFGLRHAKTAHDFRSWSSRLFHVEFIIYCCLRYGYSCWSNSSAWLFDVLAWAELSEERDLPCTWLSVESSSSSTDRIRRYDLRVEMIVEFLHTFFEWTATEIRSTLRESRWLRWRTLLFLLLLLILVLPYDEDMWGTCWWRSSSRWGWLVGVMQGILRSKFLRDAFVESKPISWSYFPGLDDLRSRIENGAIRLRSFRDGVDYLLLWFRKWLLCFLALLKLWWRWEVRVRFMEWM